MRKQEYIHLHALLLEILRSHHDLERVPTRLLAEYDALGVRPWSVNRSKREHQDAVALLATAISTGCERATEDTPHLQVK
jgi:hypothetical protein